MKLARGLIVALAGAVAGTYAADESSAGPLPPGYVCVGNSVCGSLGPDGVVTAPPAFGPNYLYVSTRGAVGNNSSSITPPTGQERNGSRLESPIFSLSEGQKLQFYFNYVTSDGSQFTEYAWVGLLDVVTDAISLLFTARTTPTGNTVPGFGLPDLDPNVTLTPPTTPIIPGGPVWSPLGSYSGMCYGAGCGYTGWIEATYTTPPEKAGNYRLVFAVTNAFDQFYDSGLAFAGIRIDEQPIDPPTAVPEPASLALLGLGLLGLGLARRAG